MSSYPVHLCLDPSVRVVQWVKYPFEDLDWSLAAVGGLDGGLWASFSCVGGMVLVAIIPRQPVEDPMVKGMEGLGVVSCSSAVSPSRKLVRSLGSIGSSLKSSTTWNLTFIHQFFGLTLLHWFLLRRGCPSVCVGMQPLHILLWDSCGQGWQVKITQGVAEPLIRGMRSWGAGRGRLVPVWMVG